ncbi:SH3-like domain-containing protein [Variovorax sp. GrIS 2.14]|uniref:SH3 domain-containing protein n=1 Tax=Variovorax sp. GrIS 2.14 TaxID=3071709 RepID=UPI0038F75BE0
MAPTRLLHPKRLLHLFILLAICWLATPAALATEMVSSAGNTVYMRAGPGTGYAARWTVDKGYPFKVLARKGKWLKVIDFERDSGWVYGPLTNTTRHHIVSASSATLRAAPNARSAVVLKARNGDVLRTLRQRGRWIQVRHETGLAGWVIKSRVWGW